MIRGTIDIQGSSLPVHWLRGHAALSETFRFELRAGTAAEPAAVAEVIGTPVALKLEDGAGQVTTWRGVVTGVRRGVGTNEGGGHLALCLEPEVAKLARGRDSRVFQELSAVDIVKKVLEDAGIPGDAVRFSLIGSYPVRTYCVQHRESAWAFVERLMAEEGIYYAFEPEDDKTVLVFSDDSTGAEDLVGGPSLPFKDDSALRASADALFGIERRTALTSTKVTLRDYDDEKPAVQLESNAGADPRARYDYPGRYREESEGDRLARVRLESLRAARDVVRGRSSTARLWPGRVFELTDHPLGSLNARYLVERIELAVDPGGGRAAPLAFHAIPAATPFRAARFTEGAQRHSLSAPRTDVARHPEGPQTAVVVGPSGSEIHTDDKGKVRAQFYWDREGQRDDNASTFMRVGQFALGGSMIVPRVGWDVIVNFYEGDADRPMIAGHLYDGTHPPPYSLPANKTRTAWQTATTPGDGTSNEIRFEDAAGKEEIFVNASKDMNTVVGDKSSEVVGVNHDHTVGANYDVKVTSDYTLGVKTTQDMTVGASETLTVSGSREVGISGSETISIGASRSVTVTKGSTLDVTGDKSLTVGGSLAAISAMGVNRMSIGSLSATVGGSWIQAAATGLDHMTGGAYAETIGGAKISAAAGGCTQNVKGACAETVGGAYVISAGGKVSEQSTKIMAITVGGAVVAGAPDISIDAESEITVRVGGASLKIKKSSIEVKAPTIAIPAGSLGKKSGKIVHN